MQSTYLAIYGSALFTLVVVFRILYRVLFHPLARFPGPRIAAATNLYAFYYDVIAKDSLVKQLQSLHNKYGPIVRIRPNELHVFDFESYHMVFKANSDFNRAPEFYNFPQVVGCFLTVSDGRVAKPHRDLFIQAFSKAQINRLEPLIHEKMALFLSRLKTEAAENTTIDLDLALNCLTGDVTMHYCYQMSMGLLSAPDYRASLVVDLHEFAPIIPVFWYFPTVASVLNKVVFSLLPKSVVRTCMPGAASMQDMMNQCRDLIESLAKAPPESNDVNASMFSTALNPSAEKGQYVATQKELAADAVLMFLAGTDTTAHALTFGIWEMMKRPGLWVQLREEVASVITDAQSLASLKNLETLPFLRAVIKESLRFSLGTSARLHRIVPSQGTIFCGERIPSRTRVSFSHYVYNNDPAVFPEPFNFKPERWLKGNVDELEKHMMSFSRGSRSCIGINLAHAELYIAFAHLAHRFDLINDGTTDDMMDWRDTYTPLFNGHLKVKLRAI